MVNYLGLKERTPRINLLKGPTYYAEALVLSAPVSLFFFLHSGVFLHSLLMLAGPAFSLSFVLIVLDLFLNGIIIFLGIVFASILLSVKDFRLEKVLHVRRTSLYRFLTDDRQRIVLRLLVVSIVEIFFLAQRYFYMYIGWNNLGRTINEDGVFNYLFSCWLPSFFVSLLLMLGESPSEVRRKKRLRSTTAPKRSYKSFVEKTLILSPIPFALLIGYLHLQGTPEGSSWVYGTLYLSVLCFLALNEVRKKVP